MSNIQYMWPFMGMFFFVNSKPKQLSVTFKYLNHCVYFIYISLEILNKSMSVANLIIIYVIIIIKIKMILSISVLLQLIIMYT